MQVKKADFIAFASNEQLDELGVYLGIDRKWVPESDKSYRERLLIHSQKVVVIKLEIKG